MRSKFLVILLFSISISHIAFSQQDQIKEKLSKIVWQPGPIQANLGDIAEFRIPGGFRFANGSDTRILMEALGNITSNNEVGTFIPDSGEWFIVFEFENIGYVKDDEKTSLDANAMLKSIKKGTEAANKIRKKNGFTTMEVVGWKTEPHYDESTHNLEWAINGKDEEGNFVINHNTRILGRKGVMGVLLVVDPSVYDAVLPSIREYMTDFSFLSGNKYAEFRQGDNIAKAGLTALIVGGAAAVAVKTGLFKWLWKVIAAGIVGIGAFVKNIFRKKNQYKNYE